MIRSLVQFMRADGWRGVAALEGETAHVVRGASTVLDLANEAVINRTTLAEAVASRGTDEPVDLAAALAEGRILAPIDHADPAHLAVTGTGLTHLGSAEGRDKMHRDAAAATTDSMRMFMMGVDGGKPVQGTSGVQPEWFYKGDGSTLVGPGAPLPVPAFAQDGSEEPEIAGIYLIGPDGTPFRLGYALGNEFSDHVTERGNYLWLAHSKLRHASIGPELLLGELPADVRGVSRIHRGGAVLWEKPFLTGEGNMSHSIRNLEDHHFKYGLFRRPGDVHVHFFGTATLSFSDGVRVEPGDEFEISAAPFALPLRNPVVAAALESVEVRAL